MQLAEPLPLALEGMIGILRGKKLGVFGHEGLGGLNEQGFVEMLPNDCLVIPLEAKRATNRSKHGDPSSGLRLSRSFRLRPKALVGEPLGSPT